MELKCANLEELWEYVYRLNKREFPENELVPIVGNGKLYKPRFMFVFINPTYRNISADRKWKGPRFPFVGTRQVWRVFHKAGLFDDKLIEYINENKVWDVRFTKKVLAFLKHKGFYLTNVVKWTGKDSGLPDSKKIKLFLPVIEEEIRLVQPEYIVTFGLIPFEQLAKRKIRLGEYYSEVLEDRRIKYFGTKIGGTKTKIIPCYFPIGRGNPKRAVEILKMLERV